MGGKLSRLVGGSFALAIALLACQKDRQRPKVTPGHGGGAPLAPGGVVASSSTSTSSTGTTSGSTGTGGATGAGGSGPTPEMLHTLTCADHEVHVADCEVCRATQTMGVCAAEWQACLDDPYCSLQFFNCVLACSPTVQTCNLSCFTKQPASQKAISGFVNCACQACTSFCGG